MIKYIILILFLVSCSNIKDKNINILDKSTKTILENINQKTLSDAIKCNDSYSLLVFSENNKKNLIEKDAGKRIYPASLTKLMTAYLVFEALDSKKISLDKILTISHRGNSMSYLNRVTTLHLKVDEKITTENAMKGMIIKSFNGAAVVLAEAISDNEWQFVQLMNKKAKKLSMFRTNFRNSSGVHDYGQYTTAYDLKKLILAIKNHFPQYYHIFSIKKIRIKDQKFTSHNRVLLEYEGAEGMKTGFTSISGFNLISSAFKKDKRIFSILTSCESSEKRDESTKNILDMAFDLGAEK
jgi:D-alanyl-D-alanine carboxypeptidase (penicillin-binding protein 5/6)